jgi:hypothetical protein
MVENIMNKQIMSIDGQSKKINLIQSDSTKMSHSESVYSLTTTEKNLNESNKRSYIHQFRGKSTNKKNSDENHKNLQLQMQLTENQSKKPNVI